MKYLITAVLGTFALLLLGGAVFSLYMAVADTPYWILVALPMAASGFVAALATSAGYSATKEW